MYHQTTEGCVSVDGSSFGREGERMEIREDLRELKY